jgi:hypothetical protein
MAIRNTRLVIKKSDIVNRPLPSSLLSGEPIVNTAEGILYFSGVTTSTNEWTPAGTGNTANFFEVGSNLYDLKLRNKITKYEGQSGSGLVGKFLSGTTNGFVLADITNIGSVTNYTYNPLTNTFSLTQSNGSNFNVSINSVSGFTINGIGEYTNSASGTNPNEIVNYSVLTAFTTSNDVYVTGSTYTPATFFDNTTTFNLQYAGNLSTGPHSISATDTFITGGTYDNNTTLITFDKNDGSNFTVDLSSIDVNDTFVTGFTYNPLNNGLTISRNQGESDLNIYINSVSGLTFSNLTAGRVVYVGGSGELTDESGFEYNDSTNLLTVGNLFVNNPSGTTANIGQGGLVIGSGGSFNNPGIGDLTVHGDLTVFGDTTTISTSELYIEDPQITLNYNPTGDTSTTSIGSGILIQDGGGVSGQDAKIGIGQLFGSSISGDTSEYIGTTGFENRGWVTQLNDIVIRNSSPVNFGDPDGVRVLAENDILDAGQY